jgi:hypothetical protein
VKPIQVNRYIDIVVEAAQGKLTFDFQQLHLFTSIAFSVIGDLTFAASTTISIYLY